MTSFFPHPSETPAVQRLHEYAIQLADTEHLPAWFLLALVNDESLGGRILREAGLTTENVRAAVPGLLDEPQSADSSADPASLPEWLCRIFDRAHLLAKQDPDEFQLTSQHLVHATLQTESPVRDLLETTGIHFEPERSAEVAPLPVDLTLSASEPTASLSNFSDSAGLHTLIDASLNRAREGLRVLEDYARFAVHIQATATSLKQMRHELVTAEQHLTAIGINLLAARSVAQDAGTSVTISGEQQKDCLPDLLTANARRVQEALRSLEEFGKLIDPAFAASMKQLRYRAYEIEQQICLPITTLSSNRRDRLKNAQLYVLLTESLCALPWKQTLSQILAAGVDVVQLREKNLSTAKLSRRAQYFVDACRDAQTLSIINDHSTLAKASRADGVHVGQDDESTVSARKIIGADCLLGVSTHNLQQLSEAEHCADYVGVGPVFSTTTKKFDHYAGLSFVRTAAQHATVPWFPIGGISPDNVSQLCESGAGRVAVSSAIIGTKSPAEAVRTIRTIMEQNSAKVSTT